MNNINDMEHAQRAEITFNDTYILSANEAPNNQRLFSSYSIDNGLLLFQSIFAALGFMLFPFKFTCNPLYLNAIILCLNMVSDATVGAVIFYNHLHSLWWTLPFGFVICTTIAGYIVNFFDYLSLDLFILMGDAESYLKHKKWRITQQLHAKHLVKVFV